MRTLNFKLPCLRHIEHPCAMAVGIGLLHALYYILQSGWCDSDCEFIGVSVLD